MSNIIAGVGRGQLLHLDEHHQLKKAIYCRYKEAFSDIPVTMNPYLEYSEPNFWLSCILIDKDCKVKPVDIYKKLMKNEIESRPIWKPMHLQPVYADRDYITVGGEDVSSDIFSRGLCLPSDIKMTEEQQAKVIEIVKSLF